MSYDCFLIALSIMYLFPNDYMIFHCVVAPLFFFFNSLPLVDIYIFPYLAIVSNGVVNTLVNKSWWTF